MMVVSVILRNGSKALHTYNIITIFDDSLEISIEILSKEATHYLGLVGQTECNSLRTIH